MPYLTGTTKNHRASVGAALVDVVKKMGDQPAIRGRWFVTMKQSSKMLWTRAFIEMYEELRREDN